MAASESHNACGQSTALQKTSRWGQPSYLHQDSLWFLLTLSEKCCTLI